MYVYVYVCGICVQERRLSLKSREGCWLSWSWSPRGLLAAVNAGSQMQVSIGEEHTPNH